MKKRILSMIIAIVMVVGLVPSFAIAASAATGVYASGTLGQYDKTAWTIYDNGLLVINGKGNTMTSVNWDSTTASPWKDYEDVITKVTFVNCQNWKSLPAHSFKGLSNLKEITLPENLEVIQQLALGYTGIETIELPQSLTTIGEAAFSSCKSLNYVNIHNGITTIEARAFWDCDNLKAISIPDSVTLMRQEVFQGCENLEYVRLGSGFSTISSSVFSGCNLLETLTIPSNVTTIGVQFLSKNASLKGVYYQGSVVPTTYAPNGTNGTFYGIDKSIPIYTHTSYESDTIGIQSQYLNDVRTVTKINGYFVNMAHSVGGAFKVDKSIVPVGDTVTVDIMAYKNYALDTFAVKDADGNEITVNGDGNTRTFAMPAGDVTISATFKSTIVPHVHSWSFEVEGTRINATCANSDGMCHNPNQSVVMTAPATKYFAWSLERTVTVSGTIEDVEVSDVVYTLKSTGEVARPFAPGVYVATITVGGVAVACEYEITKSDQLNYTFFTYTAPTNLTYDGTAKVATAVLSEDVAPYIGDIEVLYNGRKEPPVNKGEYSVTINVAESDYYSAKIGIVLKTGSGRQMKDAKFTIDAKDIADLTYILEDSYSLTDGEVTPDVTIQYNGMTLVKDTDYTIAYANNTAPGNATMTITGIGNYTGTKTLEFNISSHTHNYTYTLVGTDTIKATCSNEDGNCTATEQTVKLVAPSDLVYTGTAKTATVEGTIGGNIPEITYEGDCKSFGSHTASIMIGGVTASVSFTITECPHESYTDGDCDHCDYVCTHSTMTYNDNGDDTHTKNCPVCQYSASENHDHTNGKCVCGKKATPTYTAPAGLTATYGQTLAEISLPAGFSWQDVETTNVGNVGGRTFKVTFTPDDTENYDAVTDIEVTITVEKATPTVSLTSPIDQVMGGYSIELSPTSDASEVNRFEIVEGEGYSVNGNVITIDDGVVVGTTLTVKYRSVATENYESVEGEITLTVGVPTVDTSALENAIDALEGRIEEIEAEFGTDGEVTKLREELDALKEAVSKLDNGYATDAELAETIGNVNNTITSLTTHVKNLEDTYATKAEVNALKQDLDDQYEKLVDLINANTLEIGTINTTLGQINTTLTTLATKTDVATEVATLTGLINALTDRVTNTETGVSTNAGEISSLKTTVEALATELRGADDTFTDSVNGLSDALTTLTGRVDTAEQEIDKLQQDLADAIKDLDAAMKKGDADLSAEIASLNTALTNAKAALEKADADNKAELIKKIEEADKALDDAIKTVQKNLDDAKTELDKAIKDGDTALDTKITNLNTALTNAVAALEKADTDNKAELVKKIEDADASLQAAIDKVASDLTKAQKDLADAIATGDAALSSRISSVSASLSAAKAALEKADSDNKAALEAKIEATEATLDAAIKAVQKNLDDAKAELNKAIADGDTELDGKISALGEALATAKAALETTDSANKSELTTKIDEADAALHAAINALSNELNATNEKVAALETFIIIVCVISGVAFCGCGTLAVFYIIDKRKKI